MLVFCSGIYYKKNMRSNTSRAPMGWHSIFKRKNKNTFDRLGKPQTHELGKKSRDCQLLERIQTTPQEDILKKNPHGKPTEK